MFPIVYPALFALDINCALFHNKPGVIFSILALNLFISLFLDISLFSEQEIVLEMRLQQVAFSCFKCYFFALVVQVSPSLDSYQYS